MEPNPEDKQKFLEAFRRWEASHAPVRVARQRVVRLEEEVHHKVAMQGRRHTEPEGNLERNKLARADQVATAMEDLAQTYEAMAKALFAQATAMHSSVYWGNKILDDLEKETST